MATSPLPSPEVLRQLLRYEPDTGKLFWKERGPEWFKSETNSDRHSSNKWNSRFADRQAFTSKNKNGYFHGSINYKTLLAHRVIFAMCHGEWPECGAVVDHINMDKEDNRICNLRLATISQNGANAGARKRNSSGYKGVSWHKGAMRWTARISFGGEDKYLGLFDCPEEAHDAYRRASREMHGDFSRLS